MEMDDLKKLWNEENDGPEKGRSPHHFSKIMYSTSKNSVDVMKRNLFLEFYVALIIFSFMVSFYFSAFGMEVRMFSWSMLFVGLFYVGYYLFKMHLLNQLVRETENVISNLKLHIHKLERYSRFYVLANTFISPILIYIIINFFLIKIYPAEFSIFYRSAENSFWKSALAWTLLLSGTSLFIYITNLRYVKTLYGTHTKRIGELLKELEEINAEPLDSAG